MLVIPWQKTDAVPHALSMADIPARNVFCNDLSIVILRPSVNPRSDAPTNRNVRLQYTFSNKANNSTTII